jgi:ABC-type Zn uptake system ZnuABC Zn-binding protein ZnuA
MKYPNSLLLLFIVVFLLASCNASPSTSSPVIKIVVVESFLADISINVIGNLASVDVLIPPGVDPHSFEPAPQDVVKITGCDVLIINGAGLETWLNPILQNVPSSTVIITASQGIPFRTKQTTESSTMAGSSDSDPHFWMDPINVIQYVANIRDGLVNLKPDWGTTLQQNATAYIAQLQDLDSWIKDQVGSLPDAERLLITNHDDLGYYADRYGFQVIGSIIPSFSTDASPSAQSLANLENSIKQLGIKAIFIEAGANTQMASQVAADTGIKVVTNLYTHSLTDPSGPAPTYIQMMKYDTDLIVRNLK